MLFSINNNDYSHNLLDKFDVNEYKTYTEWIDGAMKKHKELTRQYIKGTLNLSLTEKEFIQFMKDLSAVKSDKMYNITVYVNNLAVEKSIYAYIEFYPTIRKNTREGKIYNDVSISIEEM